MFISQDLMYQRCWCVIEISL